MCAEQIQKDWVRNGQWKGPGHLDQRTLEDARCWILSVDDPLHAAFASLRTLESKSSHINLKIWAIWYETLCIIAGNGCYEPWGNPTP